MKSYYNVVRAAVFCKSLAKKQMAVSDAKRYQKYIIATIRLFGLAKELDSRVEKLKGLSCEQLHVVPFKDTGIHPDQLAWLLCNFSIWLKDTGGGSMRTLQDHLGIDYHTLYFAGGMRFTNTLFEVMNPDKKDNPL